MERDYAQGLFELDPGKSDLPKIRAVLKRRGHEKLLPRIFSEYQKLVLRKERSAMYKKVTPEKEQNRILLELYRKLTNG
ncbi:hypothetical protein A2852_02590 [Candidatus Adlerbacteria bacterium RIFCSPHIGHO2_01_FULL_54_23]|uniref:Uncharacterized protein n=3 Tax=Candidatus Adleribacteriota TaxID=1752736 RepID=A0A1F4Y0W9_9BACT|nr:MAG: hypothetical protein UY83_C0002G0008 [Candidatus Adlerbacteria bacterium GW2011_GWA1_54_10]KKW38006.1 MAG: hypothetical protein UY86_C0002G0103 [Candidatus Adlerbacteria bacterium GW2011_GWB1_54_7]OGC78613.1 MAG: hypothetical protein A2852_02590 [Candidatus Adlerbacteria bacterium RIFCSPHIGHO2_01_FULL_54_23]OGC87620.1 MAG: hypothetical protein A3B33_01785 [Candidatus Adlerbacteria bacterium RIFCSPLOWO2_01_FULL_54_16]